MGMSMKVKPQAAACIQKIAAACERKQTSTREEGPDRFVYGYLTIFHLWEDEEALKEMAGIVPPGSLKEELMGCMAALKEEPA